MQLFALVGSSNQKPDEGREVVRNYLLQQLNQKLVSRYLQYFDIYQAEQKLKLQDTERIKKRFSASSVKVLKIATVINEELNYYQKLIVLIQLLEFLNSSSTGISSQEIEFANTIADTFNINTDEYLEIYAFITDNFRSRVPGKNILFINSNTENQGEEGYLYKEHFNNELRVLNIYSANLLLLKSLKGGELTLNGQLVEPRRVYFMRSGSSLRQPHVTPLTYTELTTRFYKDRQQTRFNFSAKDISFNYPGSKAGLKPLSFSSTSGNLVGIMGDSGTGKTTLVNVLAGIIPPASGEVLINDLNIHNDSGKIKGLIGYVSQDDLLMEELTIYQNLYYNARLCFDHLSKASIARKVLALLKSLGLYEIRDMKVGNPLDKKISGGQRKRLNIALELIREPSVMFLDEPTSGLSSRDSENIMDLLKELAQKGKLIFVVIHQPSSEIFRIFNQLIVLDVGGYMIYEGDAVEAINYFKSRVNHVNRDDTECSLCGNVNPEQILTIVNTRVLDEYGAPSGTRRVTPEEWYQAFASTKINNSDKLNVVSHGSLQAGTFKIPSYFKQFRVFVTRDLKSKFANKQYLAINLLESPLLSFILASLILYFEIGNGANGSYRFVQNPNITVYIIITVIIAIFIGLTVSAEEIIADRKILKRESFLNLSRLSYLLSKVFILVNLSAIQTGLLVLVGNTILEIKEMGMAYWAMLFSVSVFGNLLGLNISDSFKKTVNIYIVIPFLVIPQLILSGVFISYDQLNPKLSTMKNIPWFGELIASRWAFEGIAVHQFKNNGYQENFFLYNKLKSQAVYRKDFWIPELLNQLNLHGQASKLKQQEIARLIYSEITNHSRTGLAGTSFNFSDMAINGEWQLTPAQTDSLILYLENTRLFYIALHNKADDLLEGMRRQIISDNGEAHLIYLRENYHNENLERFVRRTNDIFANRVVQVDDELIQKFDPIFIEPTHPFIKAHFLSPVKNVGNNQFPTLVVNIAVIWFMNILLFIILYTRLFQRIMNLISRVGKFIDKKPKGMF